ncbi:uncharacterized protein LOC103186048 isoform X1 [Callorhinchus milii]|uniref:Uncharacterized LOC103186048 n=2 Tax=Callorhinchus milii TaxID=7868 RepID=A0A4W3HUQ3_CALMI|nr:uncharacterized protein LOC103186048 isoform X1 [Callorhinchus milii]|eukprot:gi/632973220/ref/XP_007903046.1/ PREDICTED: uncharacterized protein LOC103186048 isoform X1 [Callorhinchus milii]
MSGQTAPRATGSPEDGADLSTNEKILRDCHQLYTAPERGLITIGKHLGEKLQAQNRKITVMVMGNHSAGKSSFINWYIGESVQRTGVAIETQAFSFITSGRKRESLTGKSTLHLYPQFKDLEEISGLTDHLSTEICPSRQRDFNLVTFIDTPGLVDGEMTYQFDVDEALVRIGEKVDLIYVFFEPMGQALCKRTLSVVEKLNHKHAERLRFYLSKADTAGNECDRQRVLIQVTQQLCSKPGLNQCGFDMQTIYIPDLSQLSSCVNQIEETCKTITKSVNQAVQTALEQLESDCELLLQRTNQRLLKDRELVQRSRRGWMRRRLFGCLAYLVPISWLAAAIVPLLATQTISLATGERLAEAAQLHARRLAAVWAWLSGDSPLLAVAIVVVFSFIATFLSQSDSAMKRHLSRKETKTLERNRDHVRDVVKVKKNALCEQFLRQSVTDEDWC